MKKFRTKRSISGNKKREVVYYKLKERFRKLLGGLIKREYLEANTIEKLKYFKL